MDFPEETRIQGKPIALGVLGIHNTVTKEEIHEKILHPLMSVLGRLPDKILVPSEGTSSAYISIWAERNSVDTQCVEADWRKFQRKAAILRDARILKEATHLLVFVGTKSRSNEQTAIRQVKKGKQVFLVEPNPIEMCELVVED
jgi:hypothetical protein